jgi:hypothetical protein
MDWQTYTALGIVGITLSIFLVRLARPRRGKGCGAGCKCAARPDESRAPRR